MQFGFVGALTLVFITLKLIGIIKWPWLFVLSPIILAAFFALLFFFLVVTDFEPIKYITHKVGKYFRKGQSDVQKR